MGTKHHTAIAWLACLLLGCFGTRQPEPPLGPNSDWVPPTEPSILVSNLATALAAVNITNYERCFDAAAYRFVADPVVAANNQGLFARWGLVEEVEYLKNIALATDQAGRNSLVLLGERQQFITADSVEYSAQYQFNLFTSDTSLSTTFFPGRLIFTMRRLANNDWVIAQWQDNSEGNQPCFSTVKQHFISP